MAKVPDSGKENPITRLPQVTIMHKKYTVEAFATILVTWAESEFPAVNMIASVMNEDGTPVEDLSRDDFRINYFDGGGGWRNIPIAFFGGHYDNCPGTYRLNLNQLIFNDGSYYNMVFSVEASKEEHSSKTEISGKTHITVETIMKYRGQCLAHMQQKPVAIGTNDFG